MGTALLPYWSFISGFSTVAHKVENRYFFRGLIGESGSGVGRSYTGDFPAGAMVGPYFPDCFDGFEGNANFFRVDGVLIACTENYLITTNIVTSLLQFVVIVDVDFSPSVSNVSG